MNDEYKQWLDRQIDITRDEIRFLTMDKLLSVLARAKMCAYELALQQYRDFKMLQEIKDKKADDK